MKKIQKINRENMYDIPFLAKKRLLNYYFSAIVFIFHIIYGIFTALHNQLIKRNVVFICHSL